MISKEYFLLFTLIAQEYLHIKLKLVFLVAFHIIKTLKSNLTIFYSIINHIF